MKSIVWLAAGCTLPLLAVIADISAQDDDDDLTLLQLTHNKALADPSLDEPEESLEVSDPAGVLELQVPVANDAPVEVTDIYVVCSDGCCASRNQEGTCTSCVDGMFLYRPSFSEIVRGGTSGCVEECPTATYIDGRRILRGSFFVQDGRCQYCNDILNHFCRRCTDAQTCTECDHPTFLHQGQCVAQCPPTTFSKPGRNVCEDCEEANCDDCEIDGRCSACRNNFYLISPGVEATFDLAHAGIRTRAENGSPLPGGRCVASCDVFTNVYAVEGSGGVDRYCAPCGAGCRVCSDVNECTECYEGRWLDKDNIGQCLE